MGPLRGIRILEIAGIGPSPFAAMLLSDMGAEVIRIERNSAATANSCDVSLRGRRSIALDLKKPQAVALLLKLIETADALIEGFRPGVMEKLGLGPDACLERNPALVYGRMTGWGQEGPLAHSAGHDINYIAISGALDAIGQKQGGPVMPLNLLGDFGGGATYLVIGVLAALLEARKSGRGQVVDAAICDGVISLMAFQQGCRAMGMWELKRQSNLLDGGAHFYDTYQCADDKWIALGAIEPHFYQVLVDGLGLDVGEIDYQAQFDKQKWQSLKPVFAQRIREKTRAQWCEIFEGSDACFAPVLNMDEAYDYPHNQQRRSFINVGGIKQTAPAPKFSRTVSEVQGEPVAAGSDNHSVFAELGFSVQEIEEFKRAGIIS